MTATDLRVVDDDFELVPHRTHGPACSVGTVLGGGRPPGSEGEALGPDECERLGEWLADESIQGTRIAVTLRERRGLNVGEDTVQRHRRGKCRCSS